MSIRQRSVGRGLVNHAQRTTPSLASTSTGRADYVTRGTVKQIREQDGQYRRYKYYVWVIKTSVFKLISKMKMILMLISASILSMVKSTPMMLSKEQRLSKYKAQLFDCGVPGKIQVLQIPETCDEDSEGDESTPLRKRYVVSPRKLKKTSGVSCRASVSEFRGYCGAYSHWKFPQIPVIEKSVPVTLEICNRAWREGIVTLLDLTSRKIRVGDCVLFDFVSQGIIRVDSQVTSCQGTQMVEESLVLSQYWF